MSETTVKPGQRVYHRMRDEVGVYVRPSQRDGQSVVDFPEDGWCRVTTAQLVAADEIEGNG